MRGDTTTWDNFVGFCGGLEGVQIAGVRQGVGDAFLGKRLGDVARAAGHPDLDSFGAYQAVFDFYRENRGEIGIITHYGNEATVERFFRRPTMAICTDGLMPGPGQKPHPRAIGAFPKALRMAREMDIRLEEIVYRMSTLPCRFLGLEDPVLAAANNRRRISIDVLLALCTVCACGLDMIPVPGVSFPEEISALMLDAAALSCALDKPLGARLLPIPDGRVNDFTKLNLDFLCDSRILGLSANDRRLGTSEHLAGYRTPRPGTL